MFLPLKYHLIFKGGFWFFALYFCNNSVQFSKAEGMAQWVKSPPANAGDAGDEGSIPGSGGCPGGGNGNPLQYSCLENPMDRGACWAPVRGVVRTGDKARTHFCKSGCALPLVLSCCNFKFPGGCLLLSQSEHSVPY